MEKKDREIICLKYMRAIWKVTSGELLTKGGGGGNNKNYIHTQAAYERSHRRN
jgi:hypothetical protein